MVAKKVTKAAAKKPATKLASKKAVVVRQTTPVPAMPADVGKPRSKMDDQPIRAAVVLMFTTCKGKVSLLIGKESYEKWGPPGGYVEQGEEPNKAAEREFVEEVGYGLPPLKKEKTFRYRNTHVRMMYTETCIEAKIGPKARKPHELLGLSYIPVSDLYKILMTPDVKMPLRSIFIAMMVDNKKEIDTFLASCGL